MCPTVLLLLHVYLLPWECISELLPSINKGDTQTCRQQGELISLLLFFKSKESMLKKGVIQVFITTGAEECYQQSETVLCPLCRHPWINEAVTAQSRTHSMGELDCKQRVSTDHHRSIFHSVNNVDPPHMARKFAAVITQQVKRSHHKALESELPYPFSPGAVSPCTSFGSGSSGYKSLSPGSAQAFQEALPDAGVIPSEQLPVASEWAKV
jgi:hypothetical protein